MIFFFWVGLFIISIIPLNKFAFKNAILLVLLKKIRIFIIFVLLLVKDKHNFLLLKVTNNYTHNFNQN